MLSSLSCHHFLLHNYCFSKKNTFAYSNDNFTLLPSKCLIRDDGSSQYGRQKSLTQDWITGILFRSSDSEHYLILQMKALLKITQHCVVYHSGSFFPLTLLCMATVPGTYLS